MSRWTDNGIVNGDMHMVSPATILSVFYEFISAVNGDHLDYPLKEVHMAGLLPTMLLEEPLESALHNHMFSQNLTPFPPEVMTYLQNAAYTMGENPVYAVGNRYTRNHPEWNGDRSMHFITKWQREYLEQRYRIIQHFRMMYLHKPGVQWYYYPQDQVDYSTLPQFAQFYD